MTMPVSNLQVGMSRTQIHNLTQLSVDKIVHCTAGALISIFPVAHCTQ